MAGANPLWSELNTSQRNELDVNAGFFSAN